MVPVEVVEQRGKDLQQQHWHLSFQPSLTRLFVSPVFLLLSALSHLHLPLSLTIIIITILIITIIVL